MKKFNRYTFNPWRHGRLTSFQNWDRPIAWNQENETQWVCNTCETIFTSQRTLSPCPVRGCTGFLGRKIDWVLVSGKSDVFDQYAKPEHQEKFFDLVRATPYLRWVAVTSSPDRIDLVTAIITKSGNLPLNLFPAVRIHNRTQAHDLVSYLALSEKATNSVVIINPTEPLTISHWLRKKEDGTNQIGLVVVSGQERRGARPIHPKWPVYLRNECLKAGAPFYFEGWGNWVPCDEGQANQPRPNKVAWISEYGYFSDTPTGISGEVPMMNTTAKEAGRLLEGKEWTKLP